MSIRCPYCGNAHAPSALCHVSRRRFFFLTGATIIAATLDPLSLVPSGDEVLRFNGKLIGFDLVNDILKKYYIPAIRRQLARDTHFYRLIGAPL